jgi:nicotinamide-nucleotide amidase
MTADIITIGDEILIGQILDKNSYWISHQLNRIGIQVRRITSISDTTEEILNILKESGRRSGIVFLTGGLGPTSDDVTKNALCQYFSTKLNFNQNVFKQIESFLAKRNGLMNELNRMQAMVPECAKVVQNESGTAPGLWFERKNIIYIAMPGVPFEMEQMMSNYIIPSLKERFKLFEIIHKVVLVTGISESQLALTIKKWEDQIPKTLKLAYLPSPGIVKLRLTGTGNNIEKAIYREIKKLAPVIRDYIIGFDDDDIEAVIGRLLNERGQTVAVAESCTGGMISHMITLFPGSSNYFKGAVIAYSNEIKKMLLNVSQQTIEKYGAVSKEVVETMSQSILTNFSSDYSIAVSGIAGPTGHSEEKPIGTTWISVSSKNRTISEKYLFGDNRERNIIKASITALNLLRKFILMIN